MCVEVSKQELWICTRTHGTQYQCKSLGPDIPLPITGTTHIQDHVRHVLRGLQNHRKRLDPRIAQARETRCPRKPNRSHFQATIQGFPVKGSRDQIEGPQANAFRPNFLGVV